jgi:hypothetical protein
MVGALEGVQYNTVCPIKLLLIHGLRTGHIAHPSIQSLLGSLVSSRDRRVQWTNGSDPVIPAISAVATFLDFSKPAVQHQVNQSIKAAALVAGILVPVVSHDIRAGAARDIATLAGPKLTGVGNPGIAKALGHNYKSLSRGTTDRYIGGIETAVNAEVAKAPKVHRFGPPVGVDGYVKQPILAATTDQVCTDNGLDQTNPVDRRKAQKIIETERRARWTEEQKNRVARAPDPLLPRKRKSSPSVSGEPLGDKSLNIRPPKRHQHTRTTISVGGESAPSEGGLDDVQEDKGAASTRPAAPGGTTTITSSSSSTSATADELIDPLLRGLHDDIEGALRDTGIQEGMLDSCPVDQSEVSSLESLLSSTMVDTENMDDSKAAIFEERLADRFIGDAIDVAIAENFGGQAASVQLPGIELEDPRESAIKLGSTPFVDYFSRINVTRNTAIIRGSRNMDYSKHIPMGNTRDVPTLFRIRCKNASLGCKFTSTEQRIVDDHTLSRNCIVNRPAPTPGVQVKARHMCTRDGCSRTFHNVSLLNKHIEAVHDWVPRKCEEPDCPKADVLWENGDKYQRHVDAHNSDWTPSKCHFPGCKSSQTFIKRINYNQHLRVAHKLIGKEKKAEKEKYLPSRRGAGSAPSVDAKRA